MATSDAGAAVATTTATRRTADDAILADRGVLTRMPSEQRLRTAEPVHCDYAAADLTAMQAVMWQNASSSSNSATLCTFCRQPLTAPPFNPRMAIRMCQTQSLAALVIPHDVCSSVTTVDGDDDEADEDITISGAGSIRLRQNRNDWYHDGHCWMMSNLVRYGDDCPMLCALLKQLPHWAPHTAPAELQRFYEELMSVRRQQFTDARTPVVEIPPVPAHYVLERTEEDMARIAASVHAAMSTFDDGGGGGAGAHSTLYVQEWGEAQLPPLPQWTVITPEQFYGSTDAGAAAAAAATPVYAAGAELASTYEDAGEMQM